MWRLKTVHFQRLCGIALVGWLSMACMARFQPPTMPAPTNTVAVLSSLPLTKTEAPASATATPALMSTPPPVPTQLLGSTDRAAYTEISVGNEQPLDEFARTQFTTANVLAWFNIGLPDPIPAGTKVRIPHRYIASEGETLQSIAEASGLEVARLLIVNPRWAAEHRLPDGTPVNIPMLYTVPMQMTLTEVAAVLHTTEAEVLTFNPQLQGIGDLAVGDLVVVPREK